MKVKYKKNQCLPKPLKSCTSGLDPPPSSKHQRFTFFLDIEHWTQSLREEVQRFGEIRYLELIQHRGREGV